MTQGSVPRSLAGFATLWLRRLGLAGKKCLLLEDEDSLPRPFSGSMKLYRHDGSCLELDMVAKPLGPDCQYVKEVREGNYELIVISIAGWSLRDGVHQPCPTCGTAEHTALEHTVLHELVHVAFPEYSAHDDWTERKVRSLLEGAG
jgi:hypothetical protein